MKVHRLWKNISFSENWKDADTSLLDDILPSWIERREILKDNSKEYEEFLNRLKRRHAIETGVVERMYELDRGVTETLINEGFVSSLISHNDTNIPKQSLLNHLQDHLDAVALVFDIVGENRALTKNFICELHQLVTRHQEFVEAFDQFGNRIFTPLLKGRFKQHENNPERDGVRYLYCPPEHVESEMDNLISIYNVLVEDRINPLIIATWVHHAFTTIHPFQDGNGRVARLIASLILIKHNLFPITVLREEAKAKYIQALEEADQDKPGNLILYFAEIQKRNIEEALNIREVDSTSLDEVTRILKQKIFTKQKVKETQYKNLLAQNRLQIFDYCSTFLNNYRHRLEKDFAGNISIYIGSGKPDDTTKQHYYYEQIVSYAKKHNYYFNRLLPKAYFKFGIEFDGKRYELGITLHHFGYDESVMAIGAFLEFKGLLSDEERDTTIPLDIKPHVISIKKDIPSKEKNIRLHLENILTVTIAQIASEI